MDFSTHQNQYIDSNQYAMLRVIPTSTIYGSCLVKHVRQLRFLVISPAMSGKKTNQYCIIVQKDT